MTGATEAVTPEQRYLAALDDRLLEVKIVVMRMSDGSKPGALIAEAVQKIAALRNDLFAIRSLLPKEEGQAPDAPR